MTLNFDHLDIWHDWFTWDITEAIGLRIQITWKSNWELPVMDELRHTASGVMHLLPKIQFTLPKIQYIVSLEISLAS